MARGPASYDMIAEKMKRAEEKYREEDGPQIRLNL
jgi:hypothetical protein